jgi:serine/threonine protein kinase
MSVNVVGNYEYSKKDLIGHGAFAIVFKGKNIKDERKVAIKVIQRSRLGKPADKLLATEVEILKSLKARVVDVLPFFSGGITPRVTLKCILFAQSNFDFRNWSCA